MAGHLKEVVEDKSIRYSLSPSPRAASLTSLVPAPGTTIWISKSQTGVYLHHGKWEGYDLKRNRRLIFLSASPENLCSDPHFLLSCFNSLNFWEKGNYTMTGESETREAWECKYQESSRSSEQGFLPKDGSLFCPVVFHLKWFGRKKENYIMTGESETREVRECKCRGELQILRIGFSPFLRMVVYFVL